jgi:hypothetical protein
MFDDLPALAAPRPSDLRDELERYLSTDPEHVANVLLWWFERQQTYPALSCMAMDYLTIPGVQYILLDVFVITDTISSYICQCGTCI